jgi:5-methyltetrahydrofolate--homocysteine methyltransferase
MCVGLNCALGPDTLQAFLERLANISDIYVHAYPNAGLPNALSGYDETKESYCEKVEVIFKFMFRNMQRMGLSI